MLWILALLLTAGTLAVMLRPLWQGPLAGDRRAEHDLAVYREQLKDLDGDVARGTVTVADAAQARLEIERRILRAGGETEQVAQGMAPKRGLAVALAIAVPLAAGALYLRLGNPHVPDQPLAYRGLPPPATGMAAAGNDGAAMPGPAAEMPQLIERLAARLKADPSDRQGWMLLGRSYLMQERHLEAVAAYGHAVELDPNEPEGQMALGESQVYVAGGVVTPRAQQAFEAALKLEPKHAGARYYLALAKAQAGDFKGAFDQWRALEADSPADAPWMTALRSRVADAAKHLNIDAATLPSLAQPPVGQAAAPPPPAAAPSAPMQERGPNAAQVAAAAQMSEGDRRQMIQGMVQGLADRLQQNPNDFDGWMRLGRAYSVMKNDTGARDAYAKAVALRPADPAARQALAMVGGSPAAIPGPATSAPPPATPPPATPAPQAGAPRGPTPEQMAAAQRMNPGDQQAMIRGMVDSLASRLKDNPNDFEGWMRMGRSQAVLGDMLKSRDAFAQAVKQRPTDIDALLAFAGATAEADGGDARPVSPAATAAWKQVLAQDANQPEALWYTGRAEAEAGRPAEAEKLWRKLLAQLEPGSQDHAQVQRSLNGLKK